MQFVVDCDPRRRAADNVEPKVVFTSRLHGIEDDHVPALPRPTRDTGFIKSHISPSIDVEAAGDF
jgi:hypothetical protein